jgi:hypothetical protein
MSGPVRSAAVRLEVENQTWRFSETCGPYATLTNITADTVKIGNAAGLDRYNEITGIEYAHEAWALNQIRTGHPSGHSFTAVPGPGYNYLEVTGVCNLMRADSPIFHFHGTRGTETFERDGQPLRVEYEIVLGLLLDQGGSGRGFHWEQDVLLWREPGCNPGQSYLSNQSRIRHPRPRQGFQQPLATYSTRARRVDRIERRYRVPVTPRIGPSGA